MKGRLELKQRKKLLCAKKNITINCEKIISNLDDTLIFKPLFEELLNTIAMLRDMPEPTFLTLLDTEILQSLQTLRDLCFVILEFIKNDEARQIIRFVGELMEIWKPKKSMVLFDSKSNKQIAIRNRLSQLYLRKVEDQQHPQLGEP